MRCIHSWAARCLVLGLFLLAVRGPGDHRGHAAEVLTYQVTVDATGQEALDRAVRDTAALVTLRGSAPVSAFSLVARARGDVERVADVVHSFGYYNANTSITLDGHRLDDPDLPTALEAAPAGQDITARIAISLGPVFTLRRISIIGDATPGAIAKLGLEPGATALAADVLAGQQRLLAALRADGHALAQVDPPIATPDPAAAVLDLAFTVQAGPRVNLGEVSFAGLDRINESYARVRLGLHEGEQFDPARMIAARQDLTASGAFAAVTIDPAKALDPAGNLPVIVRVTERPRRVVTVGAAFSTDQGGSATASWGHRNLFGNAEQLTLSAAATQLGGTSSDEPGYNLGAVLKFPDWLRRDQVLTLNVTALREYLRAYDRTGFNVGGGVTRRLSEHVTVSLGVAVTAEQIAQEGQTRDYLLLQAPANISYDSTDNPLDPTAGLRGAVTITPTVALGSKGQQTFVIGQASGSAYFDFGSAGRSVLAVRGLVGVSEGSSAFAVPPDQRFYAGGSGTVRGFRFQSIGPQFSSGRPVGGTAVDAGAIEFRQRIGTDWGGAVFVDAGQVGSSGAPFTGAVAVGAGVGARYYSSIGPVRVDFAVPVTRPRKGDAFELYIGIGQAF